MATPLSVSPPGILHKKPFVSRQFATGNEVTIRYNPGSVNWLASASAVNVRRGIRAWHLGSNHLLVSTIKVTCTVAHVTPAILSLLLSVRAVNTPLLEIR